jgi:DNA-binding FadR family transcriptional regulator
VKLRKSWNDFEGQNSATKAIRKGDEIHLLLKDKIEASDEGFEKGKKFPVATKLMEMFGVTRVAADEVRYRLAAEGYIVKKFPKADRSVYIIK